MLTRFKNGDSLRFSQVLCFLGRLTKFGKKAKFSMTLSFESDECFVRANLLRLSAHETSRRNVLFYITKCSCHPNLS